MMNDDMKNAIESLEGYKKTLLKLIETAIQATNSDDNYFIGLRNGLRICKLFIDGSEPEYEKCKTSAEPERHLTCKNCIHLGHAYIMPCQNCKRNQMLPDWYEVETERREE